MSTLKSSAEDLTLNADGSGNDIKFQSNGVEKASIDQDGLLTATSASFSTSDNSDNLTLTSTDADASVGPNLRMYRNSASPDDGDVASQIDFEGRNDNSQDVVYGTIKSVIQDASDGTEDGKTELTTIVAGSDVRRMSLSSGETVFNEDSIDLDFRVESDGHTDALFVEGSSGNVYFGKTVTGSSADGCELQPSGTIFCCRDGGPAAIMQRNGGTGEVIRIVDSNVTVGTISTNGSNTAYNTSSDYRLKENVDYTWDATTRLKQLKPARFNFIADDTNTLVDGFIAHEVSSVVPEAITGEKDATEMQGIDQSKLVPLLVKTIQELEARITALEA